MATTPTPGKPGLDELRRAGLADDEGNWPAHWMKVGCYSVSVEVAGVPYMMVNSESSTECYEELLEEGDDHSAPFWKFFTSVEEADEYVKLEAVKKRISE